MSRLQILFKIVNRYICMATHSQSGPDYWDISPGNTTYSILFNPAHLQLHKYYIPKKLRISQEQSMNRTVSLF